MKVFTKDSLKEALQDIRSRGWIETQRKGNDGGVGNTLEDLLGNHGTKFRLRQGAYVGLYSSIVEV